MQKNILFFITLLLLSSIVFIGNSCSKGKIDGNYEKGRKDLKAEIVIIGDEILIGQVVDTNSSWIARQLNIYGVEIDKITVVRDDPDQIMEALQQAEGKMDLVITTGGLGPTIDDITKSVLCKYFNTKLVMHEPTLKHVQNLVEKRGMTMNSFNRDQALVPEICEVLPNKAGTAPGIWIERNNTIFISLPGVPHEMKTVMINSVIPHLEKYDKINSIYHKTVLTQGLPESILSERLKDWEAGLPGNIKLAYLPDPYSVRMRLSATGPDMEILEVQVESEIEKLRKHIPDNIYGYNDETMAEVVGRLLISENHTLSVAESYTGGFISYQINSAPSSSKYFKGAITTYLSENPFKLPFSEITGENGEVAVRAMAESVKKLYSSDHSIVTLEIPGSVLIAVAGPDLTVVEKILSGDNKERNIIRISQTALHILRRMLINKQ